jgi:hypothetical protein
MMTLRASRLAIALVLLSGTFGYAALSADQGANDRGALAAGKSKPRLKAKGTVADLYPGATKPMKVRIRNNYREPVRLTSLKTKVLDASPTCLRENLTVTRNSKSKGVVRPRKRRKIKVLVTMLPTAPDACQGAQFPLKFRVRGKGA